MKEFEKILLRMKQAAGVRTDREVADLLGMTVKAFTSRKLRDSFPEDKLLALTARRPELGIDANYVLTGEYQSVRESRERLNSPHAMYSIEDAPEPSSAPGGEQRWNYLEIPAFLRHTSTMDVTVEEKRLLECYRQSRKEGRQAIMATAKAMAGIDNQQTK